MIEISAAIAASRARDRRPAGSASVTTGTTPSKIPSIHGTTFQAPEMRWRYQADSCGRSPDQTTRYCMKER
jgi:hypothetical protein